MGGPGKVPQEQPVLTLLAALRFEARAARSLGLKPLYEGKGKRALSYIGVVRRSPVALLEVGIRASRLHALENSPIQQPLKGFLGIGIAGGLDPSLSAGALVAPQRVLWQNRSFEVDPELHGRLVAAGALSVPAVLTVRSVVSEPAEKLKLAKSTGAWVVDMESGPEAAWASARNKPFAVLRAVSDTSKTRVPLWLAGKRRPVSAIFFTLPQAARLAAGALIARRRLVRCLQRFLVELGLPSDKPGPKPR